MNSRDDRPATFFPPEPGLLPGTPPTREKSAPSRLAVIEPNGAKAELLAYFCVNYWGFEVVSVAKTGASGIIAAQELKPELILAALTPADFAAENFVFRLRSAAPAAKLILFATQSNDYLLHALKSTGYHGLIYEPEESLVSIGHAIEHVRQGYRFTSIRMIQEQKALVAEPNAFPKLLSKREQQVLACIAHSLSDDEIASRLGCRSGTVLSHRRELMRKLEIHSTPKLIRYGIDKGFSSGPFALSLRKNP